MLASKTEKKWPPPFGTKARQRNKGNAKEYGTKCNQSGFAFPEMVTQINVAKVNKTKTIGA